MAVDLAPNDADYWGWLGAFLACRAGKPREAEVALRNSVQLDPSNASNIRNLGVLLYCEMDQPSEAVSYLDQAHRLDPTDPISAVVFAVSAKDSRGSHEHLDIFLNAAHEASFWNEALDLCRTYPPFGKLLMEICDLIHRHDSQNRFVKLYRAVALASVRDFPRASVAMEDAMIGDPIELLSIGRSALEAFFGLAVRCGRVRDCIELISKKNWKDAWRPIYEALVAVETGSEEYLKRVAVEIRNPAQLIYRRIAPVHYF